MSNELSALSLSALRASLAQERAELRLAGTSEWEHEPATPEEFIESREFLGNCDNKEYWPLVVQDVLDFYKSRAREGIFEEAIGSGKSYKAAIVAAYEAHRLLCLKNPQKTLGLSSDSRLTILNMGTTAGQARKVVFSKIKGRIDSAPWFRILYPYNKKIVSELRFPKNIYIVPGNSKETFPLGYDLVMSILDEMDFYVDSEDRPAAEEIYLAMMRRMESRIGDRYPWKMMGMSSPQYEEGFTEKKMAEGVEDPKRIFSRRRAIWESKPWQYPGIKVPWSHNGITYSIPDALITTAKKNPAKFLRDFAAVAVTSLSPYFTDHEGIMAGVDPSLVFIEATGGKLVIPETFRPRFRSYVFHIDLAKSRDSAALALGHQEERGGVVDLLVRIKPTVGHEVNFAAVRQIILDLRLKNFKIAKGSFDGWQSVDSIQLLTAKGIEVEELSVDRTLEPYDTFLEAVNERRAFYPDAAILRKEMKALELKKGLKVDHPPKGSKDCSDAVAGVFYHLRSEAPSEPQAVLIKRTGRAARQNRGRPGYYERGPY